MLLCFLQRSAGLLTIAIDCIDSVTGYGVYTIYAIADLSPTYLHSFNYAHSYGCIVYDSVLDMKNKKVAVSGNLKHEQSCTLLFLGTIRSGHK